MRLSLPFLFLVLLMVLLGALALVSIIGSPQSGEPHWAAQGATSLEDELSRAVNARHKLGKAKDIL